MGEGLILRRGQTNRFWLYKEGNEFLTNWVAGFLQGTGTQAKESDHLRLTLTGSDSQITYVTDGAIPLVNISTLFIEWAFDYTGSFPTSAYAALNVSTNKTANQGTYNAQILIQSPFARKIDTLNVSSLTGQYYIRGHNIWVGGATTNQTLRIYRVWGVK